MQLKSFLKRYDTVLLDMDGVITSEEVYWNTAALTVWELLFSHQYYGNEILDYDHLENEVSHIRRQVFVSDAVIKMVKNRGINNNWDLAWLVAASALILKTHDFEEVFRHLSSLPDTADGMIKAISEALVLKVGMAEDEARHPQGFWLTVQNCFQEWFLGSELFAQHWSQPSANSPKKGLAFREEPIVDKDRLVQLLELLGKNKRLGIGTGRPQVEAITPLKRWGVLDFITPDAMATYQDVLKAQAENPGKALTKPHPYIFLKAIFGNQYTSQALLAQNFDPAPCKKTLVIGDAGCDLFAAKAAGCDFAAVLTGIEGTAAKSFFEHEGAEYIMNNILDLLED